MEVIVIKQNISVLVMMMLVLFTFSCRLEYEEQEEAVEDPVTLTNIKAYEGLGKEEIEENFYLAEFMEVQTIQNALHIAKELQLDVSHVKFSLKMKDGTVKNTGFILLPDSFDTSEFYIRQQVNQLIQISIYDLKETKKETGNPDILKNINNQLSVLEHYEVVIRGFQAVIFPVKVDQIYNSHYPIEIQKQYFHDEDCACVDNQSDSGDEPSMNFEPNESQIKVYTEVSGTYTGKR